MVILRWHFCDISIDGCAFHGQSSCMECILLWKRVFWAKVWVQISLDWEEVEGCNLAWLIGISEAINGCIDISVHLYICPWAWVLESGVYWKLQFILVLLMLGDHSLYGGFLGGCSLDHYRIRLKYWFGIKIPKIRYFLIVSYLGLWKYICSIAILLGLVFIPN